MAQAAYPILPILVGYPIQAQPQVQQPTQFATNKHVLPLQTICQMKIARLAKEQIEQNERNEQLAREQITERPRKVLVGGKARAINNVADFAQQEQLPQQVTSKARKKKKDTSGPSNQVDLSHPFYGISIEGKNILDLPNMLLERVERCYHILRSENNIEYAKSHFTPQYSQFSNLPIVNSIILGDINTFCSLLFEKEVIDKTFLRDLLKIAIQSGQANIIKILMNYIPENERAAFIKSKENFNTTLLMPFEERVSFNFVDGSYSVRPKPKINPEVINIILEYIPENERVNFIKEESINICRNNERQTALSSLAISLNPDVIKTLLQYIPENEREALVDATCFESVFSSATKEDEEDIIKVFNELMSYIPENKKINFIKNLRGPIFSHPSVITPKVLQTILSYIPENERIDFITEDKPITNHYGRADTFSISKQFIALRHLETFSWLLENYLHNFKILKILGSGKFASKERIEIIKYLIDKNYKIDYQIAELVFNEYFKSYFNILTKAGFPIDSKDALGYTALMLTARVNQVEKAELFIEFHANPNEREKFGNTALHIAAALGFEEMTQVLLRAGADASIKNNDGKTALDLAKDANQTKITRILTDHFAHK